jgi:hypothetical protein
VIFPCHFSAAAVFVLLRLSWDSTKSLLWSSFCASRTRFPPAVVSWSQIHFPCSHSRRQLGPSKLLFTYRRLFAHMELQDSRSCFLGSARPVRLAHDFPVPSSAVRTLLLSSFFHLGIGILRQSAGPWLRFSLQCSCTPVVLRFPTHGLGSRSALPPIWSRFLSSPASISYVAWSQFCHLICMILPPPMFFCEAQFWVPLAFGCSVM